jgi:hypothetical protein
VVERVAQRFRKLGSVNLEHWPVPRLVQPLPSFAGITIRHKDGRIRLAKVATRHLVPSPDKLDGAAQNGDPEIPAAIAVGLIAFEYFGLGFDLTQVVLSLTQV